MYLIFRLGRLDVMAEGDVGLCRGMQWVDGLVDRPSPRQLLERSEVWRPLRSVASWYLWRFDDAHRASRRAAVG